MTDSSSSSPHSSSALTPQARRALVRDFKQAFPPMGVYAVRCDAAGIVRVGASRNVDGTLKRLQFELTHGSSRDAALAKAWARHGAEAFRFDVLDRVKEREAPDFDYDAELQMLLALWQFELQGEQP